MHAQFQQDTTDMIDFRKRVVSSIGGVRNKILTVIGFVATLLISLQATGINTTSDMMNYLIIDLIIGIGIYIFYSIEMNVVERKITPLVMAISNCKTIVYSLKQLLILKTIDPDKTAIDFLETYQHFCLSVLGGTRLPIIRASDELSKSRHFTKETRQAFQQTSKVQEFAIDESWKVFEKNENKITSLFVEQANSLKPLIQHKRK